MVKYQTHREISTKLIFPVTEKFLLLIHSPEVLHNFIPTLLGNMVGRIPIRQAGQI